MNTPRLRLLICLLLLLLAGCQAAGGPWDIFGGAPDTTLIEGLRAPAELRSTHERLSYDQLSWDWETAPLSERRVWVYRKFGSYREIVPNKLGTIVLGGTEAQRDELIARMAAHLGAPWPDVWHLQHKPCALTYFHLEGRDYSRNEMANAADWLMRTYSGWDILIEPSGVTHPAGE